MGTLKIIVTKRYALWNSFLDKYVYESALLKSCGIEKPVITSISVNNMFLLLIREQAARGGFG